MAEEDLIARVNALKQEMTAIGVVGTHSEYRQTSMAAADFDSEMEVVKVKDYGPDTSRRTQAKKELKDIVNTSADPKIKKMAKEALLPYIGVYDLRDYFPTDILMFYYYLVRGVFTRDFTAVKNFPHN